MPDLVNNLTMKMLTCPYLLSHSEDDEQLATRIELTSRLLAASTQNKPELLYEVSKKWLKKVTNRVRKSCADRSASLGNLGTYITKFGIGYRSLSFSGASTGSYAGMSFRGELGARWYIEQFPIEFSLVGFYESGTLAGRFSQTTEVNHENFGASGGVGVRLSENLNLGLLIELGNVNYSELNSSGTALMGASGARLGVGASVSIYGGLLSLNVQKGFDHNIMTDGQEFLNGSPWFMGAFLNPLRLFTPNSPSLKQIQSDIPDSFRREAEEFIKPNGQALDFLET